MSGPLPSQGPSSVRISGDHYQHLIAWAGCLQALQDAQRQASGPRQAANPVLAVGIEALNAGHLDDVVLYRARPPHRYQQVKYAVDASTPLSIDWLTAKGAGRSSSVLGKIGDTWKRLRAAGEPFEMRLVTNREIDPGDTLLSLRDARTLLLLPKASAGGPRSGIGKARASWASAAGLTEEELLQLLEQLQFDTARAPEHVVDLVRALMVSVGLRADDQAIAIGTGWIGQQVREGNRILELSDIQLAVSELDLPEGVPRAVLSVATLKPDPAAARADHALDWFERFEGETEWSRRRPRPPHTWRQLQDDLQTAASALAGYPDILLTGSLRQATAFAAGAAFRMVTGSDVAILQRGQLWSSRDTFATPQQVPSQIRMQTPLKPDEAEIDVGQGPELAVALEFSTEMHQDVLQHLQDTGTPVGTLLILRPPGGEVSDHSVTDSAAANALAMALRNRVRQGVRGCPQVHLFLAGPMGLSLLLGQRWNRVAPTKVYEDLGARAGYELAFEVDA